jgi:hypothetical protein
MKGLSAASAMAKLSISGSGGSPPHHTSAMIRTVEQAAQQSTQSGMLMVMGSGSAGKRAIQHAILSLGSSSSGM